MISFLWGVIVFPQDHPVNNLILAIVGIGIMLIGLTFISISSSTLIQSLGKQKKRESLPPNEYSSTESESSPLLVSPKKEKLFSPKKLLGLICTLFVGVLNGSVMVPLAKTPQSAQGINYIVSFGIGVVLVTPVCLIFYFILQYVLTKKIPEFHFKKSFIPGLITGILWNIGNYCRFFSKKIFVFQKLKFL